MEEKQPEVKNMFQSEIFQTPSGLDTFNPEEWEEIPQVSDPFPKLYNMADQSFTKNGKKYRRRERGEPPKPEKKISQFNCGHCGIDFSNLVEYTRHKMTCIPDEDFGLTGDIMDSYGEYLKNKESTKMDCEEKEATVNANKTEIKESTGFKFDFLTGDSKKVRKKSPEEPSYTCGICLAGFEKLKEYTSHKTICMEPSIVSGTVENKMNNNSETSIAQNLLNKTRTAQNNTPLQIEKETATPKTGEIHNENKENANSSNVSMDLQKEENEQRKNDNMSQEISSKENKVNTKPPKILKSKKDHIDTKTEDSKSNGKNYHQAIASKHEIGDKNGVGKPNENKNGVGKPNENIQMESLRESLPPASKTSGLFCIIFFSSVLITSLFTLAKFIFSD